MQNTGTEKQSADRSAAVTTECCARLFFCARYLVISRETVSGIPEAAAVARTAKTDRADLIDAHAFGAERAGEDDAIEEAEKLLGDGKCRHIGGRLIEIALAQSTLAWAACGRPSFPIYIALPCGI